MRIGKVLIKLRFYSPATLKEKRALLKGLTTRVKREFNVSIAEVGALDDRRRAELGVAMVSNDGELNRRVLAKVVELLEREGRPEVFVEGYEIEIL